MADDRGFDVWWFSFRLNSSYSPSEIAREAWNAAMKQRQHTIDVQAKQIAELEEAVIDLEATVKKFEGEHRSGKELSNDSR